MVSTAETKAILGKGMEKNKCTSHPRSEGKGSQQLGDTKKGGEMQIPRDPATASTQAGHWKVSIYETITLNKYCLWDMDFNSIFSYVNFYLHTLACSICS